MREWKRKMKVRSERVEEKDERERSERVEEKDEREE